jgi:hypothetical protein
MKMPIRGDTVLWRRAWRESWEMSLVVAYGFDGGDPPVDWFRAAAGAFQSGHLTVSDHGSRWLWPSEAPSPLVRSQRVGIRPLNEPARAYDIFHCDRCFEAVVWAWDDMFPDDDSPLMKRTMNLEAMPPAKGHVILYYAIDADGNPMGRQMFRRWEPGEGYQGETWTFHASTCGRARP